MLAVSGAVVTNVLLVVVTVPMALVAWVTLRDRRERAARLAQQEERREQDRRTIEMVATAFFGADRSKWPKPEDVGLARTSMSEMVQAVAHQVKPSNGKTVAAMVEEVRQMVQDQQSDVGDLREGMAKMAVLVAEHVSDGHGGRTSW